MKYMGSKSRIVNYILPIIQRRIIDNKITTYVEPFVGGANVIDKVRCDNKIASDIHKYLIAMFNNLDGINSLPDFITKEHYSEVRECFNKMENYYPDWYIGAVGFLASYNGRFFDGGYAGLTQTKTGIIRNYYDEAKRNLIEQIPRLKNIKFKCCDYKDYDYNFKNVLFYCDIPYYGTKQYGANKNFNYKEFWDWAERMSKKNTVIVSEHNAPDNWKCIWERGVKRTIDNNKRIDAVERLFELSKS